MIKDKRLRAADGLMGFSSQVTVAFLSGGFCLCPSALGEQQAIWAGKQASFSVRENHWAHKSPSLTAHFLTHPHFTFSQGDCKS